MTAPAPAKPKATAATACFAAIRHDILTGALPPGSRLKIEALSQRYASSINPVREALNRLTAEGLVVLEDQRGFSVAPVSLEEWRDVLRARCMVEAVALREAIAHRTPEWEEGIVLSLHWLTRTPRFLEEGAERLPNPQWEPRHHRFHNALLASCGSQTLLAFCEDLRERSDRYRYIASRSPQARQSTPEEHQAIADATVAGDADRAVQLLTAHYTRTLTVVEAALVGADQAAAGTAAR